jgi:hypothetical protein
MRKKSECYAHTISWSDVKGMILTGNKGGRGGKSSHEEEANEIKPWIKLPSHASVFFFSPFSFGF